MVYTDPKIIAEHEAMLAAWLARPIPQPRDNLVAKPLVRYRYPGGYRIGKALKPKIVNVRFSGIDR